MATTPNLGLHQWQSGDSFLRTNFNEDFGKIDAGIAQRCRMACGTYAGNASSGVAGTQTIALPFTPKAVYVLSRTSSDIESYSGLALTGDPYKVNIWGSIALEIVAGGFAASSIVSGSTEYYPSLNREGRAYQYLAWG